MKPKLKERLDVEDESSGAACGRNTQASTAQLAKRGCLRQEEWLWFRCVFGSRQCVPHDLPNVA
jgi:hypothetical protein